jgi:hypothetical protein
MSELLGMDEASLSRALQKKSILESLPGGEALFNETGDALLAAAKSAGATEEQIAELVKSEDTRTTDQKIEQTLAMMVDSGIKAQLVDQTGTVTKISDALTTQAGRVKAPGAGAASGVIEEMSKPVMAEAIIESGVKKTLSFFDTITLNPGESNEMKGHGKITTGDDLIATPTGYGDRILLAGEDTFALNNNDTIVAGTNLLGGGGSSNDKLSQVMMQVGAMIVSAINRKQTDQLFNSGINAPTYG